jgi:N-acetylglutamate synthase-like GNAT family acetyltransferase
MDSAGDWRYAFATMKHPLPASRSDNTALAETGRAAGVNQPTPVDDGCIRNDLRPGDLGSLIRLHGTLYAAECGWDHTFEAYVAGPLAQFALQQGPRDRIWLVEHQGQVAGSIAIVKLNKKVAQLRWFLLNPHLRGRELGKRLLDEALSFSRKSGYSRIELWTTRNLTVAAHLYRSAGFELSQEITHRLWGQIVTEQRYDLRLTLA